MGLPWIESSGHFEGFQNPPIRAVAVTHSQIGLSAAKEATRILFRDLARPGPPGAHGKARVGFAGRIDGIKPRRNTNREVTSQRIVESRIDPTIDGGTPAICDLLHALFFERGHKVWISLPLLHKVTPSHIGNRISRRFLPSQRLQRIGDAAEMAVFDITKRNAVRLDFAPAGQTQVGKLLT